MSFLTIILLSSTIVMIIPPSEAATLEENPSSEVNPNEMFVQIQLNSDKKVPDWIKTNAKWWADGSIDEDTFLRGIEFLMKE